MSTSPLASAPATTAAAIYVRISSDPRGEGLGVARQEAACRQLAARLGWTEVVVYRDNDTSATRATRRPAYDALLYAIKTGAVRRVIVWDLDRLTRKPMELETFMALADERGVELANVTGDVDLGTVHGRMIARIKGAVAKAEVEKTAERLRAKWDQNVEQGKPTGARPYGWHLNGTPRESEAIIVREIVQRIGEGHSITEIARDLNRRGIPGPRSDRWLNSTIRSVARRTRNVGQRTHRGKVVGEGPWLPLVTEAEWAAALAVLDDPARKPKRGASPTHLLSYIATCAECGGGLRAITTRGLPAYQCSEKFCVQRPRADLDSLVEKLILGRVAMPDIQRRLTPVQDGPELLDRQLDELRERQASVLRLVALGHMREAEATPAIEEIARQIAAVQAQATGGLDSALLAPLMNAPDPRAVWNGLTPAQRRRIVQVMFSKIALRATGKGLRTPIADVVEIKWRRPEGAPGQDAPETPKTAP